MLRQIGVQGVDVRAPEDLEGTSGLIIPGGESTTLRKLLGFSGLDDAIRKRAGGNSYGLYGTCAGMILLAREIINPGGVEPLGLIDIKVARNAYGRQLESFEADVEIRGIGPFHIVFIRAPQLVAHGAEVEVLGAHDGVPIIARQGNVLVSSFHPEIAGDPRVHRYFVEEVCQRAAQGASPRKLFTPGRSGPTPKTRQPRRASNPCPHRLPSRARARGAGRPACPGGRTCAA